MILRLNMTLNFLKSSFSSRFISSTTSYLAKQATKLTPIETNYKSDAERTVYEFMKPKSLLLQRKLGGLEILYHHTLSRGTDVAWLLTKVKSAFPVNVSMVEKALYFVAQKHPLLRMTIQCNADEIYFREFDTAPLDILASNNTDWLRMVSEEVSIPFDVRNGPLWRCRFLKPGCSGQTEHNIDVYRKSPDDLVHESTFLFVAHHSVTDGRYMLIVFKHFVETLNKISLGQTLDINSHHDVSLPQPMENVVCPTERFAESAGHITDTCSKTSLVHVNFSDPETNVLEDYEQRFYQEIRESWSEHPKNQCFILELSEHETSQVLRACKEVEASVNGALFAASLLSFIDLVYPSSASKLDFSIPFECMLDLRNFCPKDIPQNESNSLTGVASVPVPMVANLKLPRRPVTAKEFWGLSTSFSRCIRNEIKSLETFKGILESISDSRTLISTKNTFRKSPYVLCVSGMGCLDNVLTGNITKRARLSQIYGNSSILIEDSPVFYICFHSLHKKLFVSISFCVNYTAAKTVEEYMKHLKKYILSQLDTHSSDSVSQF